MKDLFGNEVHPPKTIPRHGYKRLKYARGYKRSNDPIRRCKYCRHCVKVYGNTRDYYKCRLIGISSSEATDIRLRNVCMLWDMDVKTLEDFKRWFHASFFEGQESSKRIIKKVKELYENNQTTSGSTT